MKSNGLAKKFIGSSAALVGVLAFSGEASAQAWALSGSDTWFDVMTQSLVAWDATGTLTYAGGGSGTAETALVNNTQCVGAMSRPLKCTVITAHPHWAMAERNAAGLDAASLLVANTAGHISNIPLPKPHVPAGTDDLTNLWRILLAGRNGTGTADVCGEAVREEAMFQIALLQNTPSTEIAHFYRRDDNSGTTDTMKERLGITGFCNGTAIGIKGTNPVNPNLNNQDRDPIRRACQVVSGQRAASCTLYPATTACNAGEAGCTQGLVVGLSIGDNDGVLKDVTSTIGSRLAQDPDSVGFAGREAARKFSGTYASRINGVPPSDNAVRLNQYLLARILWINFAGNALGSATCENTLATSGGAPRVAAEESFYAWATDPETFGRCNLDPILKANGFIPCTDDCTADLGLVPVNLCKAPYTCF